MLKFNKLCLKFYELQNRCQLFHRSLPFRKISIFNMSDVKRTHTPPYQEMFSPYPAFLLMRLIMIQIGKLIHSAVPDDQLLFMELGLFDVVLLAKSNEFVMPDTCNIVLNSYYIVSLSIKIIFKFEKQLIDFS